MTEATRERLFGTSHAFDHPVTVAIVIGIGVLLVVAPIAIVVLHRLGRMDDAHRTGLFAIYRSWLVLTPLFVVPVLLGAAYTIAAVCILSLLCHRELARATGLFRERLISVVVVLGILAVTFAVLDHWYGLFVALTPLTVILLAVAGILPDRPTGYIQRVALGCFAFLFFGAGLGHLGYWANSKDYRPVLLLILAAVELNDVFAYVTGKTFGRRKLAPNTSPKKTVAGAAGALILTTILFATAGHWVFAGTPVAHPVHLVTLGVIVSVAGQLGDLTLSSVKRDLGVKDLGTLIPGHGGLLDRFDSLLLVAPGVFHYVGYFQGVGLDEAPRIITGAGA